MPTPALDVVVLVVAGLLVVGSLVARFLLTTSQRVRLLLRYIFNRVMALLIFLPLLWWLYQLRGLLADILTSIRLEPNKPIAALSHHAADVANTDDRVRPLVFALLLAAIAVQVLALPSAAKTNQGNAA